MSDRTDRFSDEMPVILCDFAKHHLEVIEEIFEEDFPIETEWLCEAMHMYLIEGIAIRLLRNGNWTKPQLMRWLEKIVDDNYEHVQMHKKSTVDYGDNSIQ